MRNQIIFSVVILPSLLLAVAMAQWQVNPQLQQRNEPVYPRKPYSFQTAPPGYDPFQFNWYSGRWDYTPIPYESVPGQSASPYQLNQNNGQWNYVPQPAAPPTSPPMFPQSTSSQPPTNGSSTMTPAPRPPMNRATTQPDDGRLWASPATEPVEESPQQVNFQGRLVGIRTINLRGSAQPELLLRLRDRNGKTATIAIGQRLHIPESYPVSDGLQIAGVGKAGDIDNAPVVFADQISINSKPAAIDRGQ